MAAPYHSSGERYAQRVFCLYFDLSMQRGLPLTMTLHFNCLQHGLQRLQRLVCHVAFSRVLLQSFNGGRKEGRGEEADGRTERPNGRGG